MQKKNRERSISHTGTGTTSPFAYEIYHTDSRGKITMNIKPWKSNFLLNPQLMRLPGTFPSPQKQQENPKAHWQSAHSVHHSHEPQLNSDPPVSPHSVLDSAGQHRHLPRAHSAPAASPRAGLSLPHSLWPQALALCHCPSTDSRAVWPQCCSTSCPTTAWAIKQFTFSMYFGIFLVS